MQVLFIKQNRLLSLLNFPIIWYHTALIYFNVGVARK